jgi:hypothetical protein
MRPQLLLPMRLLLLQPLLSQQSKVLPFYLLSKT